MRIEYEATYSNINKNQIRRKLKRAGAKLIKPEFLQKRVVFNLPTGHEIKGGWLRVRDEGDKITLSLKIVDGERIENQRETCLKVDNFNEAVSLLISIGCHKKAYQETKRELWVLDGVEITLDEWPFLEPLLEIEGKTEKEVQRICLKLGLDFDKALFCSIDTLYAKKYGISNDIFNNHTPLITFKGKNPFLKN